MSEINVDEIDKIIDPVTKLALVDRVVVGYHMDTVTREYLGVGETSLVTGFGLPAGMVLVPPPEREEDAILVHNGKEWVNDKALFTERRVSEFEKKRKTLDDDIEKLIVRLERKSRIGEITEEESIELTRLIKLQITISELDPSDPNVVLPNI